MSICKHKIDVPYPFSDVLHLMSLKYSSEFNLEKLTSIVCRPSGIWVRKAGYYTKGQGSESRVRRGCKTILSSYGMTVLYLLEVKNRES